MSPLPGRPRVHRLRRNHGTEVPGAMVFFDCEATRTFISRNPDLGYDTFRLGCATYVRFTKGQVSRRDTLDFSTIEEFWQWIEEKQSKHRPLWCFAHNLGYDLTLLHFWRECQTGRYRVGSTRPEESAGVLTGTRPYRGRLCTDGFPAFVYALGSRGICKFVDTLNYYPKALSSLTEAWELPKMTFPGLDADDATMTAYCRRDVDCIERLMLETMRCWLESDGGVWQPTAGMLALTSFRHKLPKKKRPAGDPTILYDAKDDWIELERESYYGGQVTCWYVGSVRARSADDGDRRRAVHLEEAPRPSGPLYLLDVRSLYPSVMRDRLYPFRRHHRPRRCAPGDLLRLMQAYGAVAHVKIDSQVNEYTLRTDKGQSQATGRFDTCLAGPELLRALQAGDVAEIHTAQTYCMDYLFRDWVDDWTRVRDEGDRLGDRVRSDYAKMILNSLSGKFAQHGEHWAERHQRVPDRDWGSWIELDRDTGEVRRYRAVAGVCQERVAGAPPWYTFPSISAYVTAYGREHMRWLRSLCPPNTVLYQATDSLLCTEEAYFALDGHGLIQDRQLGYLRVKQVEEDGDVKGCNHYRLGKTMVCAGAWGKAKEVRPGVYSFTNYEGLRSILASQPDGSVAITECQISEPSGYAKGKVGETGWVTYPHLAPSDLPDLIDAPFRPGKPLTHEQAVDQIVNRKVVPSPHA